MIIALFQKEAGKIRREHKGKNKDGQWKVNVKSGNYLLGRNTTEEDRAQHFILTQLNSAHHQNKLRAKQTYTQSSEDRATIYM